MLTFDPVAHIYRWEGAVIPHVTGIIAPLTNYDRIPAEALERARQQGVAIHKMVELELKDDLDREHLPAWLHGHLAAWYRFKEETGFECWATEQQVHHAKLHYGGTLDLAGLLPKIKYSRKPAVIDVKRSFYAGPAIGLQTAGYLDAWNSNCVGDAKLTERYALALYPNGIYRLEAFTDREDHPAFVACLQQLRWKEKHYGRRRKPSVERATHDDTGDRERAIA